jgi:arsenate reductase-like glutaredoxin family protein
MNELKISELLPMLNNPLKSLRKETGYGFEQILRKEEEKLNELSKNVDDVKAQTTEKWCDRFS